MSVGDPSEWRDLPDIVFTIAEARLAEAVAQGAFDDLPQRGRPLHLEDDRRVPAEQRLAFRLLRQHGFAPEWIELDKAIRADLGRARALWDRFLGARQSWRASEGPSAVHRWNGERLLAEGERLRDQALQAIRRADAAIERLNLSLPVSNRQRARLRQENERRPWDEALAGLREEIEALRAPRP